MKGVGSEKVQGQWGKDGAPQAGAGEEKESDRPGEEDAQERQSREGRPSASSGPSRLSRHLPPRWGEHS